MVHSIDIKRIIKVNIDLFDPYTMNTINIGFNSV